MNFLVRIWVFGLEKCNICNIFLQDTWKKFEDPENKYITYKNINIQLRGCYKTIKSIKDISIEINNKLNSEGYQSISLPLDQLSDDVPLFYVQVNIPNKKPKFYFLSDLYNEETEKFERDIDSLKRKVIEVLDDISKQN